MTATACAAPATGARVVSADELCRAMRAAFPSVSQAWANGLDRVLRHDPAAGRLEVQARTPWATLAALGVESAHHGTVGDAVAENRPGPDGRPIDAHVAALTLASADGHLRRASRELAPELFRLAVGGMGAFGPFYSITLDLDSLVEASRGAEPGLSLPLPTGKPHGTTHVVELLLPPDTATQAADRLREAVAERRLPLTGLRASRARPEDVTLLRWACREFVLLQVEFASAPTLGACAAAAQLRARMIELAIAAGGSIMPAMLASATRAQAQACYPMLGEFLAEKQRLDPADRASSPWSRAVTRAWRLGTRGG